MKRFLNYLLGLKPIREWLAPEEAPPPKSKDYIVTELNGKLIFPDAINRTNRSYVLRFDEPVDMGELMTRIEADDILPGYRISGQGDREFFYPKEETSP